ncbi:hypothetical protein ABIE65_005258 [Constrictibacter sp. MBR-5]|jgi:hypothetical protein
MTDSRVTENEEGASREADTAFELPPVLDPAQLVRIEAVHRGFLYQHLYAVGVILLLGRASGATIVVERDEDIEFRTATQTTYIQVKTRLEALRRGDIVEALERLDALRAAHAEGGGRAGDASFAIVSNAEPGAGLAAEVNGADWPADVALVTPLRASTNGLPGAGSTVESMLTICREAAAAVPFGGLRADTLVLKLASLVQRAASGAQDHTFTAAGMPELLEQLVIQLQDFPNPPAPYRPQRHEPPLVSDNRARLIIGFSGAGKTAWAAEGARLVSEPTLYFDIGDLPSAAVPTNLAREIVARFIGGGTGGMQLPPGGGLDVLRASDRMLDQSGQSVVIVLDNVHRLRPDDFRQIIESAPHQRFVGLAQPWPERALLEATLQIEGETLSGLDEDGIASFFRADDVAMDYDRSRQVGRLTGGLPLFVINAAKLTASRYGGDVSAFCAAIEARAQDQDTAQDLILETIFEALPAPARDAAALLGQCDVPLLRDEIDAFLTPIGTQAIVAGALRALRRASLLTEFARGGLGLHDAVRPLAAGHSAMLAPEIVSNALEALHLRLIASLHAHRDIPRLTFLVRLLPRVGRTDVLVDLATSEMFYEQGNMAMMWDTLVTAADNPDFSPRDRFWALDALAYWESRDGGTPNPDRIAQMATLVAEHQLEAREALNLIFKQLIIAGTNQNRTAIERFAAAGRKLATDPIMRRILRYNRAVALFRIGAYSAVRTALEPLIDESFTAIGVREQQMLGANGEALVRLFADVPDREEIKRTADALNLWATTMTNLDQPPMLRRVQASKLYALAGAGRSAAAAACDTADDMLAFVGSPEGAREAMEQHALPLIRRYQLTDLLLPARGQYAVILAYCGDFAAADREIEQLLNYGGESAREHELANQIMLIEGIRAGVVPPPVPRRPPGGAAILLNPNQVGRQQRADDPCRCGSGRKYKRCHGKR